MVTALGSRGMQQRFREQDWNFGSVSKIAGQDEVY
jgi:hypothetical protein